jgi:hypothetical protein
MNMESSSNVDEIGSGIVLSEDVPIAQMAVRRHGKRKFVHDAVLGTADDVGTPSKQKWPAPATGTGNAQRACEWCGRVLTE